LSLRLQVQAIPGYFRVERRAEPTGVAPNWTWQSVAGATHPSD
jgi:hypothetical protein